MIDINKYTVRVEWSDEDDAFLAKCIEFPSIITHGNSRYNAIEELESAISETIKWMEEDGEKFPEPLSSKSYKGNISLRIPSDTHKELAIMAADKELSINQFITTLIEKNLYSDQITNSVSRFTNVLNSLSKELESMKLLNYVIIKEIFLLKNEFISSCEDTQKIYSTYEIPDDNLRQLLPERECTLSA